MAEIDVETLLAHGDFMRALARSLLGGDDARADDVVQEAYVKALESPPRDPRRMRAWLGTVVRNFALRQHRDRKRRERRESHSPRPPVPSSEEILERENARRKVVMAVLDLEEPYRTTVVLRFLEERPPREVARLLDVPVETVRTRAKRALERLRARLDADYGDRRAWALLLFPFAVPQKPALAAGVLGVLAVSTKAKLALAAVLVLCLGLLSWKSVPERERETAPTRRTERVASTTGPREEAEDAPSLEGEPAVIAAAITGRVLDADGNPLRDAWVHLRNDEGTVAETDATGPDGAFAFDHEGTFTLGAAHPEHAPARMEVTAPAAVDLVLPPAVWIDVKVLDAKTKEALEGAEVLVLRTGDRREGANSRVLSKLLEREDGLERLAHRLSAFDHFMEAFQALEGSTRVLVPPRTTDAAGRARVGGLLPGELEAVVTRDGYPPLLVRQGDVVSGAFVEIALHPGGTVRVVAPRFGGRPAVGFTVELDRAGLFPMPAGKARFDDDGIALLEGIRPGTYVASVSRDGAWRIDIGEAEEKGEDGVVVTKKRSVSVGRRSGAVLLNRTLVVTEDGAELDLSEIEGARVEGRVVAESPHGWMVVLKAEGKEAGSATTDAEGRFVFEKVPPGNYTITAHDFGGGGGTVEVEREIGVEDVEVVLHPERGAVFGLVAGPDGAPLGEATVWALPPDRDAPQDVDSFADLAGLVSRHAEADADGTYRLDNLAAGDYVVYCSRDGWLARADCRVPRGGEARLDLKLDGSSTHRLFVRLADVRGYVLVRSAHTGVLATIALGGDLFDPDQNPRSEWVYHLAPGHYLLDVFAAGFAPRRGHEVDLRGDEELALRLEPGVPVTLTLAGGDGPLANRDFEVRDELGFKVSKSFRPFEILLQPAQWRTDNRGRAVLPHLAPGTYTAHMAGRALGTFRVGRTPARRTLRAE